MCWSFSWWDALIVFPLSWLMDIYQNPHYWCCFPGWYFTALQLTATQRDFIFPFLHFITSVAFWEYEKNFCNICSMPTKSPAYSTYLCILIRVPFAYVYLKKVSWTVKRCLTSCPIKNEVSKLSYRLYPDGSSFSHVELDDVVAWVSTHVFNICT